MVSVEPSLSSISPELRRLANGHPTIFDITSANVRIENLDFEVDLTKLNSAVLASAANISNLAVLTQYD